DRLAGAPPARRGRWVRLYLTGWAVASVGLVLAIGLGGRVGFVVGMAAWVAIVTVGATWAGRQGALAVGTRRRIAVGAVYGAVLVAGLVVWPGSVAYWVPAALVSAVPLLVAAWRPARRDAAVTA
ncbi:MAG: hypothetical protein ACTMHU_05915, partial [Cellulosimicrobium funkei]